MLAAHRVLHPPASDAPVAGMLAWYAADRITSPPASGSALASWNDLSGNGYTASQGTGSQRPTYETNVLNGKPVVRFAQSSTQFLATSALSLGPDYTLFAVADSSGGSLPEVFIGADVTGGTRIWQFRFNTGDVEAIAFSSGGAFTATQTATLASFNYLTMRTDASTVQAFVNGTGGASTGISGTLNSGSQNVVLGDRNTVGGSGLTGDIAEVLIYNTALSTTDRQTVESYLASKWGL